VLAGVIAKATPPRRPMPSTPALRTATDFERMMATAFI